ncbi:hypothetical protein DENIS_1174 [Desulfonema ishimotonii]|uniref:DUF4154 domain-containing protein n=1 Tax=Desulfonema ishimotonii TaxID=45657 RepID=A0A401FTE1_9BACT|nr:YfiR family protein [Desulfonema ishimotonii]GBC60223.1 hypothetical protein DENIS_1174 [Desulfonema ishimotonii]
MTDAPCKKRIARMAGMLGLMVIWAGLLCPARSPAQPLAGSEYQVKAGFIFHFVRFTQWPVSAFSGPDSPLVICIAAQGADADILFGLSGKVIRHREIIVRRYRPAAEADVGPCHLLFIASEDRAYVRELLSDNKKPNLLTVGETGGFTKMGGIINFFMKDNRLRFEVSRTAAREAGLKFSAQLLMSAEIVRGGE